MAAALRWSPWRHCQAGSQLYHPVSCWLRKATLSPAQHLLDHIRCCVQLWAPCCGNGSWSKFSRGQQPAEVSKMEPGFAQWPMVGGQKTPGINCNKRGSDGLEGKTCLWWEESGSGAAAQRGRLCTLSSQAFKARPDKTHSNLVSPCSGLKSTRGPFHPELP